MFDFSADDPSEWPLQFIGLKQIDSLLRCSICFEFFNIAMIIPCCSHNYCSLCIRKHITYKQCCPTCNSPLVGGDLKCNRILDELVKSFKTIREQLVDILKLYNDHGGFTQKTLNKHRGKSKVVRDKNVCDSDEFQFEELPVFRDPNSSQNKSRVESKGGDSSEMEMTSCPVCSKKISMQKINLHLDTCLDDDENSRKTSTDGPSTSRATRSTKSKQKESVSPPVKNAMKPIVLTRSLNALQDKELKSKASQYGVSLQGNRKQLMKRIEQYIILHNSQCDALNPMSLSMIAKEVSKNERNLLLHGYIPSVVPDTRDTHRSSEEKVDFSIKYTHKHEGQYQQLIGEIKGRQQNLKKAQNKCVVKESVNNDNNSNNSNNNIINNELIEIEDSDPADKEAEETISAFGYVPTWFDTDLLQGSVNKKNVTTDLAKGNVEEEVVVDKGIKRKSKKSKSDVKKKKIIQSGNIASYFAGNSKKEMKNSAIKNNPTCSSKLTNKGNPCIFLVEDSDEQSEHDKTIDSPKSPSPMHTTDDDDDDDDDDDELMQGSPSILDTEITENVLELAEELESDVGDAFNSTAVAEPEAESLFISNELSPVLFKESSTKPCYSRSRRSCSSGGNSQKVVNTKDSLDSQLSLEISHLVDKAVESPQAFSSDSENDYSFENQSLIPVKKIAQIVHKNISMKRQTREREENSNVIPAPPSDFCFSQAEF